MFVLLRLGSDVCCLILLDGGVVSLKNFPMEPLPWLLGVGGTCLSCVPTNSLLGALSGH